ncbi:glycosyltransferase [Dokdonia ponticola]
MKEDTCYGYGPYVKEMNIWNSHVKNIEVVGHKVDDPITPIDLPYKNQVRFTEIPETSLTSYKEILLSIFRIPIIFFKLLPAMRRADHIHLRCPGNIGLIGVIAQVFFPAKKKTVKYAGNWDPKAIQPWSYRLQKYIVSNTILTKNTQVLVYGKWENQSNNITPFFTATYPKSKIPELNTKAYTTPLKVIFVGSLSIGKRPLYALQWMQKCKEKGMQVTLDFYGDGQEREGLELYIKTHQLQDNVILHGNQDAGTIEKAYKNTHFMILPSKSEGWPKVVAEAMFWGVIPLVTPISCVPWMLDHGKRGILLTLDVEKDVSAFAKAVKDTSNLEKMARLGQQWSHQYTLDDFEEAIKKLL